jgi:hypothetical protein
MISVFLYQNNFHHSSSFLVISRFCLLEVTWVYRFWLSANFILSSRIFEGQFLQNLRHESLINLLSLGCLNFPYLLIFKMFVVFFLDHLIRLFEYGCFLLPWWNLLLQLHHLHFFSSYLLLMQSSQRFFLSYSLLKQFILFLHALLLFASNIF